MARLWCDGRRRRCRCRTGQPERMEHTVSAISRWRIDPDASEIRFTIRYMMINVVRGRFDRFAGYVDFDDLSGEPVAVRVEIEAASINTGQEQRDIHLRSGDFFDVENYPDILFVSRAIERVSEHHFHVIGDMRLHGVTRELVLDANFEGVGEDPWGNLRAGFTATAELDRRDHGLVWNRPVEAGGWLVGEKVRISLDVQAVREQDESSAS